ncbi:uncharacterized protein LOC144713127 isoform X2 [Wolffia australiana]
MALIENGSVSGVVPETECFVVHYPGYPSSISRAVETLGGLEEINKKRSFSARRIEIKSENRNDVRLELRFRPEDPYCHPAFGDLRPCNGLILKISRKKRKKGGQKEAKECELSVEPAELSCCIVARVNSSYHFDGLADYQFVVPVHAARSRAEKRRREDVEPTVDNEDPIDMEHDELFMLVPKLFSTKDKPDEILLKASVGSTTKHNQQLLAAEEYNWEMGIAPCLKLPFGIKEVPVSVNWEDNIPKNSSEWAWQLAVSQLFNERPIWPRWSLLERLLDDGVSVSYNQLRRLLPRSGYYFSTGPFGQFWIRKGYDPRTDPESRFYQRVEFRLRDLLPSFGGLNASAKREGGEFGGQILEMKYSGAYTSQETKQRWKDICHFQIFPKKSCTLQLFELDDDYIQGKIREAPWQTVCTHSTGWFSRATLELLSLHVKMKFLRIFPRKGAQKLLKTLRERFEKLKRLEILSKDHGRDINQDGETILPRERGGGAATEVDDYSEEEEEEEEVDEYRDVDNGSFPLEEDTAGENINTNYLQELLCNKIIESEENPPVDMSSGDEYQIYEQDSNEDEDW